MAKSQKDIWHEIEAYAHEKGIKTRYKGKSWFMKLLGAILFFNPKFMTDYITTIHRTVYWPGSEPEDVDTNQWITMAHECVHAYDSKRLTFPVFGFLVYLFPQSLAMGILLLLPLWVALALLISAQWWWMLLGFLFFVPFTSPGRLWAEMRGYSMTMACYYWYKGKPYSNMDFIVEQFTTGAYYWMWPFEKSVRKCLAQWQKKIESGEYEKEVAIAGAIRKIIQGFVKSNSCSSKAQEES